MRIKEYKYFVSYVGEKTDGNQCFGECVLTLSFKIATPDDINRIINIIKIEQGFTNIVPMNYIRMK